MAGSVAGLTVEIGANTKPFTTALKEIQKEAKGISADLKTVSENLKLDPKDAGKVADKLKLLKDAAENAGKKVEVITAAIQKFKESNADKSSDSYKRSLESLERQLESAKREQDLANAKVEEFGKSADESGKHVISLGDIIKANLISSVIKKGLASVVSGIKSIGHWALNVVKSVAKGIKDFTVESVKIAEENKQTLAKVGQVFDENAQKIIDWSKKAVDAFGLSSGEAQEAAAVFGNMFRGLGIGSDKAAEMSMSMVQLAADVAAFNNTTTEAVLEDFQSMLAGTSKTVRKYGIVLTEAAVKEKAVAMGLAKSTDAVTDADKAMARYALMLEQTTHQAGQFARESNSITVQTQKIKARITELKSEIGEQLLPIWQILLQKVNEFLASEAGQTLFNTLINDVGELANKIKEFLENGGIDEWVNGVKEKIPEAQKVLGQIKDVLLEVIPKMEELIEKVLNFFGIETESSKIKGAYKDIQDAVKALADEYNTDTETIRTAAALFAEDNDLKLSEVYDSWEKYEPEIKKYLNDTKTDYRFNLITQANGFLNTFANKNLLTLTEVLNNWTYFEPEIKKQAAALGIDYNTDLTTALGYIQTFATDNGTSLSDVLTDWETYEPQVKTWLDTMSTDTSDTQEAVKNALDQMPTDAQASITKFASIDFTDMDNFREKVRTWAHDIISFFQSVKGWFDEWKNLDLEDVPTDPGVPEWQYGDGAWDPYDPFSVGGGAARSGRMSLGNSTKMFVPSQKGTANGSQTNKVVNNNNSRNYSGGINIYVNSYGMNVAEVADELGQAFQNRMRMSGAIL